MPIIGRSKAVVVLSTALLLVACLWISGLFYSILALLLPAAVIVLVTKSTQRLVGGESADAFKIVLGALTVGAILFWVLQGSLSTRLDVKLSGQAYEVSSSGKHAVVAFLRIANIGNNNVSVESAKLMIIPKKDGMPTGDPVSLETSQLGLAAGRNKDSIAVKMGVDRDKYFITWGTEETRQLSQVLSAADYYELYLEIEAAQAFPHSVSTWRAFTVIPVREQIGHSPVFEETAKARGKEVGLIESLLKKSARE